VRRAENTSEDSLILKMFTLVYRKNLKLLEIVLLRCNFTYDLIHAEDFTLFIQNLDRNPKVKDNPQPGYYVQDSTVLFRRCIKSYSK